MLGVCWVVAVSKVGGTRYSFFVFKLKPKNAYCGVRRCWLVLSASSAVSAFLLLFLLLLLLLLLVSAAGASAAAAAAAAATGAAATALRHAGCSCSVFYSSKASF